MPENTFSPMDHNLCNAYIQLSSEILGLNTIAPSLLTQGPSILTINDSSMNSCPALTNHAEGLQQINQDYLPVINNTLSGLFSMRSTEQLLANRVEDTVTSEVQTSPSEFQATNADYVLKFPMSHFIVQCLILLSCLGIALAHLFVAGKAAVTPRPFSCEWSLIRHIKSKYVSLKIYKCPDQN